MTETLPSTASRPKALAVAALVVGIVAVLTVFFGWVAIVAGAAALVLGIVALRKRQSKPLAVSGIVTGSVGLVGGAAFLIVMSLLLAALTTHTEEIIDGFESGDTEQILEELDATVED